MWCTFSLCENVITLGELIGLLILFCHPFLSILFLKTPKIRGMTSLALYNGTIFTPARKRAG